uniref:C2H2-type domain-containing protein n=1 Tax=Oryzias latipes TaxID=8090 RepID=A0A3P9J346_ORYLA
CGCSSSSRLPASTSSSPDLPELLLPFFLPVFLSMVPHSASIDSFKVNSPDQLNRPPNSTPDKKKRGVAKSEVMSDLTLRVSQDSMYLQTLGSFSTASGPLPSRRSARRASRRSTKLYRCPNCPFLSHYPNHLARHSLTHSEEKPHHCPCCSYSSSHLDNLKRHMRVHTGEKPYQCPSCSYACGNLANLRRHERIHSGAKPFHCSICGYSCNQSMNLKRHMLRHTGEKPYACGECGYTTGHWDNYKRHQRKHGHNTDTWDKHAPINGFEQSTRCLHPDGVEDGWWQETSQRQGPRLINK